MMQKGLLVVLLCGSVLSASAAQQSQILRLKDFTARQIKQIKEYHEEGSGDGYPIATDKGLWWMYIENPAVRMIDGMKSGECIKVSDDAESLAGRYISLEGRVKKVKCPR
ncbi:MAG: hypothetical protein Q4D82_05305 [Neisseria sp.]|nr:hypothetical protein [Neisseria sp.]